MSLTHSIEEVSLEELVEEKALLKEAEDSKELLEEEEEPQESGGSEREHERKVQDMLKQYMESEEYRLLESSYPTKISSTIIFVSGSL